MTRWLLIVIVGFASSMIVEPEWKIYYDVKTNQTIDIIDSNNPRVQYYKTKAEKLLRLGFGPIPCSCQDFVCGCCAGMNIEYFNFNQKGCMNFTYDPQAFSLTMDMIMNDNSLFAQSFSGKNPPPACMPVPIPYLPSIDFCIRFFNIHTPGYNIFMCIDFETRIERAPILVLHFDCMQMGADGIQYHKPEDAETGPEIEDADTIIQNEEGPEVYDEVYEEGEGNATRTSTASPVAGTDSSKNETSTQKAFTEEIYDEVFEEDETTKKPSSTTTTSSSPTSTSTSTIAYPSTPSLLSSSFWSSVPIPTSTSTSFFVFEEEESVKKSNETTENVQKNSTT